MDEVEKSLIKKHEAFEEGSFCPRKKDLQRSKG